MTVLLMSDDPNKAYRADQQLARALSKAGFEVVVETHPELGLSDAAAFGHDLSAGWADERPDVVIAHGWLAGLAAQVAGRGTAVPVIQRFGGLARALDDPARARLEVGLARGAAAVLASSSEQAEQLALLGIPRRKAPVVPLGVDTSTFTDDGRTWARNGRRRLVAADDLSSAESLGALIAVLPSLPSCELLVVTPPAAAGLAEHPVASAVVAAAQRRHVADRLKFVGPLDDAELAALLRSADVGVVAGHDTDDASFVLQAMSCGVPVVACESGAVSDAVADGVTGILVPPRSPGRLGDAVRSLLADGLARETFGMSATDRTRARFSWDVIAETTGRVIEEVRAPRWHSEAAS